MKNIPTGEARELGEGESWDVLCEYFGFEDVPVTRPMPLDELPHLRDQPLVPTERDKVLWIFGRRR